jgi:hypothetical protein
MRILTIIFALISLNIYSQSDYSILRKACRLESDSLFNIFIQRWKNNVNQYFWNTSNDSINDIQHLVLDFYENQLNKIHYSFEQYLIFDLRKIQIEFVNSDLEEEKFLFRNSAINYESAFENLKTITGLEVNKTLPNFFSDRSRWEITSQFELKDFNCNVGNAKALYLNEVYKTLNQDFIKRINRFGNRSEKDFYARRIYYYWKCPDYGSISKITMFSSGKAAIISYSTGSICFIAELYLKVDNKWESAGKLDFTCISVRK